MIARGVVMTLGKFSLPAPRVLSLHPYDSLNINASKN